MSDAASPDLLSPLAIGAVTLRNRIAVSPMCQYCAADGMADDWHLVHLGSRAAGGAALVIAEATAVTPEGRISPGDLGIWDDRQIEPLARIARFVTQMGAAPGIQLAHAGRKGSTAVPYRGGGPLLDPERGAWPTVAPSPIPFGGGYHVPEALDEEGIRGIVAAFRAGARRAVEAGFTVLEIHSAHGYLLHQFLSPLSNTRNDRYGGSLENRIRLPLEVVSAVRAEIPREIPLFVRISATDWAPGGWSLEQSATYARELRGAGVDLIDVSSGGLIQGMTIPVAPGYNVPFASTIRDQAKIMTGAVGLITEPAQADEIIRSGKADIVLLARAMLRNPYWAHVAGEALGAEPAWPLQYRDAVKRRR